MWSKGERALCALIAIVGCNKKAEDKAGPPPVAGQADAAATTAQDAARRVDAAAPIDAAPTPDVTAATKAAFPELLDVHKRFIFEIVEGKGGLAKLKPHRGAPRIVGTTSIPEAVGDNTRVFLSMRPEGGKIASELGQIGTQTLAIIYYEDGIRQLAALGGSPGNKNNIRGFTFPTTLDEPVTIHGRPDFGTAEIKIKRDKIDLGKTKRDVMIAESTLVEAGAKYTFYELMAYAPGVGPALICSGSQKTELSCLRWVATDDRLCKKLAAKLCEGKDEKACDDVFVKLLNDDNGKPKISDRAERDCEKALAKPAELDNTVRSP